LGSTTGAAWIGTLAGMDRTRHCARPGCGDPSRAIMTYEYASRTVWLHSPGDEPDPTAAWGLCASHSDNLRVPMGWALEDRRTPIIQLRPPIAV
jgi:uncharacterized protein DUF3499